VDAGEGEVRVSLGFGGVDRVLGSEAQSHDVPVGEGWDQKVVSLEETYLPIQRVEGLFALFGDDRGAVAALGLFQQGSGNERVIHPLVHTFLQFSDNSGRRRRGVCL
jgi:hypothetical protein